MPEDKIKEYDELVKKAEDLEIMRRKMTSELASLEKGISEFETRYNATLDEFENSVVGNTLPMTSSTRIGEGILVAEYIDIRKNESVGKYKVFNRFR